MREEEFRQRVAELESRLRTGPALTRDERLFLLAAYLVFAHTRRDLKYGHA